MNADEWRSFDMCYITAFHPGVLAIHCNDFWVHVNYMTVAATWDPRYCEAVCPSSVTSPPRCRRQKWQMTPATATQVAWTTHEHVRTCMWVWSVHTSEPRDITCHMGSHNVTCHQTQVNAPRLNTSQSWYSIYLPRREGRLSWHSRLATCQDGLPASRRSPIEVLTGPGVE